MYYKLKSLSEIEKGTHNFLIKDHYGNITNIKFFKCTISIELYNELHDYWHSESEFEKIDKFYFKYKDAIINKYYFEKIEVKKKIKEEEELKWYKIKTKKQLKDCGYDFKDDELYISSLKGNVLSTDDITNLYGYDIYGNDVFSYFNEITIDDFVRRGKSFEEMKKKYPDIVDGNVISKDNITKNTLVRLKPITEKNKHEYKLIKLNLLEEFTNWHKVDNVGGFYIGIDIFGKIHNFKIKDCWFRNVSNNSSVLNKELSEEDAKELRDALNDWKERTKEEIIKEYKEKKMDLKERGMVMFNANKDSFKNAARLEVGNAAISQASGIVKKRLPKSIKKYADNPLMEVAVANLFAMAIQQFASDSEKANMLSDAMMDAAALKFVQSFDIPGLVDEFVKSVNIDKLVDEKK